jgi:hypothetical protein
VGAEEIDFDRGEGTQTIVLPESRGEGQRCAPSDVEPLATLGDVAGDGAPQVDVGTPLVCTDTAALGQPRYVRQCFISGVRCDEKLGSSWRQLNSTYGRSLWRRILDLDDIAELVLLKV